MDIKKLVILEEQAWAFRLKLNRLINHELVGYAVRYTAPNMKRKLYRAHATAYERFKRRQEKLFNYYPDGFAPSPRQPSGAVGEGIQS